MLNRADTTASTQAIPQAAPTGTASPASTPLTRPAGKLAVAAAILAAIVTLSVYGPEAGIPLYDSYKALLFLHVTIALITFGSTFAMPVLQPMAARGGVVTLRLALKFAQQLERAIITPGSFLVIATGVGLLLSDQTGYRNDVPAWLVISLAWVLGALVLAHGVQGPNLRRAVQILEDVPDTGPMPRELAPIAKRMKVTGQLLSLSTLGLMFLMIWKPGA
jgi:hypothetical protein